MYYNYLQGCQRTAQTCCPPTLQIVGYIYRLCDSLLHLFVSLSLPLTWCNNDVRLSLSQAQFFPAVLNDCITSNTFLCSSHTSGSIALLVITSEKRDWNECFRNVPNIRLCWTKPPQQRPLITNKQQLEWMEMFPLQSMHYSLQRLFFIHKISLWGNPLTTWHVEVFPLPQHLFYICLHCGCSTARQHLHAGSRRSWAKQITQKRFLQVL